MSTGGVGSTTPTVGDLNKRNRFCSWTDLVCDTKQTQHTARAPLQRESHHAHPASRVTRVLPAVSVALPELGAVEHPAPAPHTSLTTFHNVHVVSIEARGNSPVEHIVSESPGRPVCYSTLVPVSSCFAHECSTQSPIQNLYLTCASAYPGNTHSHTTFPSILSCSWSIRRCILHPGCRSHTTCESVCASKHRNPSLHAPDMTRTLLALLQCVVSWLRCGWCVVCTQ